MLLARVIDSSRSEHCHFRHRPSRQSNPYPKPTKPNLQTQPGGWLQSTSIILKRFLLLPSPPPFSLWSITQTKATYGGLCGMPACGQAVGCQSINQRSSQSHTHTGRGEAVSVTRRSSGVAPRACVRVYARVLVPPNLYIYIHTVWQWQWQ